MRQAMAPGDYLSRLFHQCPWEPIGKRYACYTSFLNCSCPYTYAGRTFHPFPAPDFLLELAQQMKRVCGTDCLPHGCNLNLYEGGTDNLGWHADAEPMLVGPQGQVTVLSLSLGAPRIFGLRHEHSGESRCILLGDGDVLVMTGLLQRYFKHAVLSSDPAPNIRINLTFRFVGKHATSCQCLHRSCPSIDYAPSNLPG